jgi:hypothetical protein
MILKNFRLYTLLAFSVSQMDTGTSLYFTCYDGEIRQCRSWGSFLDSESCFQGCHHLFAGGQIARRDWLMAIEDFQTEEEMVACISYFNNGGRTSTTTRGTDVNRSNWGSSGMIILGSGDTPPTPDDYKLDSWIPTTNLRIESYSIRFPLSDKNETTLPPDCIGTFLGTFRNVTLENITVKEIGLLIPYAGYWPNGASMIINKILLVRDVLESPVIIKPGELYTFSLTIK